MPGYLYEKPSSPHWSELPPPYSPREMDRMRQKGERVSKLTRTYMKEMGIKQITAHECFTRF